MPQQTTIAAVYKKVAVFHEVDGCIPKRRGFPVFSGDPVDAEHHLRNLAIARAIHVSINGLEDMPEAAALLWCHSRIASNATAE